MPTQTFFGIPEEKRKKIITAAENEFKRTTLDKALISNIVKEAEIARGSFYQYFEDMDDLFFYIVESFLIYQESEFLRILIKNNGDIFKATIEAFELGFDNFTDKGRMQLIQNVHKSLSNNKMEIRSLKQKRRKLIDETIMNIDEDLFTADFRSSAGRMLNVLKNIQWNVLNKVFSHKLRKDVAVRELKAYIDLIRFGIRR